jgi:hypothetical protein
VSEWIKVIVNPLGIAGFALFLVFGYVARAKKPDRRPWVAPLAFTMAIFALIGGFSIAYLEVRATTARSTPAGQPAAPAIQQRVRQRSAGDGSPNVQGVQGDVTITVDQSTGKSLVTATKKNPLKQASP